MNVVMIFIMCTAVLIVVMIIGHVTVFNDKCKKVGYILVPIDSQTCNLEKLVKAYYWEEVFENENMAREIILVIMENSENDEIADKLAAEYTIVSVVHIEDLEDYLKSVSGTCMNQIE